MGAHNSHETKPKHEENTLTRCNFLDSNFLYSTEYQSNDKDRESKSPFKCKCEDCNRDNFYSVQQIEDWQRNINHFNVGSTSCDRPLFLPKSEFPKQEQQLLSLTSRIKQDFASEPCHTPPQVLTTLQKPALASAPPVDNLSESSFYPFSKTQQDNNTFVTPLPIINGPFYVLPTVSVRIYDGMRWWYIRSVSASTMPISRISWDLVRKMGLDINRRGDLNFVRLNIRARFDNNLEFQSNAIVVDKLPWKPYSCELDPSIMSSFNNLCLADPKVNGADLIHFEIGADIYPKIIREGFLRFFNGNLLAQNTDFGFILMGFSQ